MPAALVELAFLSMLLMKPYAARECLRLQPALFTGPFTLLSNVGGERLWRAPSSLTAFAMCAAAGSARQVLLLSLSFR